MQTKRYDLSDLGNAELMSDLHGNDLRYIHQWKCWCVWDGIRWIRDETGGSSVWSRAVDTIKRMEEAGQDKWAAQCRNRAKITAMIECVAMRPGISISPNQFDANDWELNTQSGIIDLRTGKTGPHRREALCTKLVPYEVSPEPGPGKTWANFLSQISCERSDWEDALLRYLGYSLTGTNQGQKYMLAVGKGQNGKSVTADVMMRIMGDYAGTINSNLLLASRLDKPTYELESLKGVRFCAVDEPDATRSLDREFMKDFVTGRSWKVCAKYGHPYQMVPKLKLFLMSNHRPRVDFDFAFARRTLVMPFDLQLDDIDRDDELADKLEEDAPYILHDLILGCRMWQKYGLSTTAAMHSELKTYQSEYDSVGLFIEDQCLLGEFERAGSSVLLQRYNTWAKSNHEPEMSSQMFATKMQAKGYERKKSAPNGGREFHGVSLKSENERVSARHDIEN